VTAPLAGRVQRIVSGDLPVLHLETQVPSGAWPVTVDGAVEAPAEISTDAIRDLGTIDRRLDLHCVWGWSRPGLLWTGVHINALARLARPAPTAKYVRIHARSSPYASCFTLQEARDGILAWRLDEREMAPERGWPLRFVPPAYKWAYKGVKWVERITFLEGFEAGVWEDRVGDPVGDVPWEVLQRFGGQADNWRARR
jgi:DMSO/TMAO reductase YedYZ molybdopterin-dependent catalytic subunit